MIVIWNVIIYHSMHAVCNSSEFLKRCFGLYQECNRILRRKNRQLLTWARIIRRRYPIRDLLLLHKGYQRSHHEQNDCSLDFYRRCEVQNNNDVINTLHNIVL